MQRVLLRSALAFVALAIAPIQTFGSATIGEIPIVAVRAVENDALLGTAVLVAVDSSGETPLFVFVTARAVLTHGGDAPPPAGSIRLETLSGAQVDVAPFAISYAHAGISSLAFIRLAWPDCGLQPIPIDVVGPATGGVFLLVGISPDGSRLEVAERVQSRTINVLTGERVSDSVAPPLGAAALSMTGMFGIVTDARRDGPLMVAMLRASDHLLARPGSSVVSATGPEWRLFEVKEKRISGPVLTVACDSERTGELEVPYRLALNEQIVDATASLTHARSVRLADVTVVALTDRTIKLRFTMAGTPPPAFIPPGPCSPGQALVTVRVNVVSFPPQE